MGQAPGNQAAARQAYELLGEVVGDALANALTLIDGLAVIGGGLAGAAALFMPRLIAEMNGTIAKYNGERLPRLAQRVYDLTDAEQTAEFLRGEMQELTVPRSTRKVKCDPLKRIGIGISELGTNQSVALGAYAYALQQLANGG
jgi:glucokinase